MRFAFAPYRYDDAGDSFGYHKLQASLQLALARAGVEFDERADVVLHVCAPGVFARYAPVKALFRRKTTTHVLLTMWESADFIAGELDAIVRHADLILTPNAWCTWLFGKRTGVPAATIPLGFDPVPYVERPATLPTDRPFRWLLVGAFNPRKGIPQLVGAWHHYFADKPALALTIKSTMPKEEAARMAAEAEATGNDARVATPSEMPNFTHDARWVPREELEAMYRAADGFILPTMGEGWSFPALEALSSGVPCVLTACQGILEYADGDVARMLPWEWRPIGSRKKSMVSEAPDGRFRYAYVRPDVIAGAMLDVMTDYPAAVARARAAAWRAREFTWERSAGRLLSTLFEFSLRRPLVPARSRRAATAA